MPDAGLWLAFAVVVVPLLALDLGVMQRRDRHFGHREAVVWSLLWVALGLGFGGVVAAVRGSQSGVEYLTGYVIEKSLSVDNVFLFAVIFGHCGIPAALQHRVLFWGVLGAIVMRGAMIAGGTVLVERFHWMIYVFGGLLLVTGVRMFLERNAEADPARSPAMRLVRRLMPVTERAGGGSFFVRIDGVRHATPLFVALVLVEFTDLVFAVDSIPAILAVTRDPFIVFTSNVFAILGLRALYFLLAGSMERFAYLKVGLSAILVFVGIKMMLPFKLNPLISLTIVMLILAAAIGLSVARSASLARRAPAAEDAG